MKKYIFNKMFIAGFISLLVFTNSCTDDFVTISPEYSIDSENFFNSEDDYYMALIASYDLLQATYANAIVGEFASNNTLCGGESAVDVVGWQQIDDMIHTITFGFFAMFFFLWIGINTDITYVLKNPGLGLIITAVLSKK